METSSLEVLAEQNLANTCSSLFNTLVNSSAGRGSSILSQGARSVGDLFRNDRFRLSTSELVERLRAECRYIQEQREAAKLSL